MDLQFFLGGEEAIRFTKAYPPGMDQYRIPCNHVYAASDHFGKILIQEIVTPNFTVCYTIYQINMDVDIAVRASRPYLVMELALENEFEWNFASIERFYIKDTCWNLFYLPDPAGIYSFKKGAYIGFDILFSTELLFSLEEYFPFLTGFLSNVKDGQPALLLQHSPPFTIEASDIVNRVLTYHYEKEIFFLYTDHYVRNLVLLLLRETGNIESMYGEVSTDIAKMYKVQKQLESDLVHSPNLDRIAQEMTMSVSKLNKYFTKMFGKSPKEYWKECRLEKAADELKKPIKPVKQIAKELGYRQGTFIDAFKKKFGMTPLEWRRKFE